MIYYYFIYFHTFVLRLNKTSRKVMIKVFLFWGFSVCEDRKPLF